MKVPLFRRLLASRKEHSRRSPRLWYRFARRSKRLVRQRFLAAYEKGLLSDFIPSLLCSSSVTMESCSHLARGWLHFSEYHTRFSRGLAGSIHQRNRQTHPVEVEKRQRTHDCNPVESNIRVNDKLGFLAEFCSMPKSNSSSDIRNVRYCRTFMTYKNSMNAKNVQVRKKVKKNSREKKRVDNRQSNHQLSTRLIYYHSPGESTPSKRCRPQQQESTRPEKNQFSIPHNEFHLTYGRCWCGWCVSFSASDDDDNTRSNECQHFQMKKNYSTAHQS